MLGKPAKTINFPLIPLTVITIPIVVDNFSPSILLAIRKVSLVFVPILHNLNPWTIFFDVARLIEGDAAKKHLLGVVVDDCFGDGRQ